MKKRYLMLIILGMFLITACKLDITGKPTEEDITFIPIEEIKTEEKAEENITEEINKTIKVFPELGEEKLEEKPIIIIVNETDSVRLSPEASDPDKDKVTFTYTSPLDEKGEWKTTYGSAGEYTVTVTASDGQLSASKNVLIIVNKKEEPPKIDSFLPQETILEPQENSVVKFSVVASDLNKDPLSYSWKLDENIVSQKSEYSYNIGYDGAGSHTVKVDVSDKTATTSQLWSLKVKNLNRLPVLEDIPDIKAKETDLITLKPKATDADGDKITFEVSDSRFKQKENIFEWLTTYDDAGDYSITLTAFDGTDKVSKQFKVAITNVNRPPVIVDIKQR